MLSDSDGEYSSSSASSSLISSSKLLKYSSSSTSTSTSQRGGEAPMEIDSPPPLWLKSPQLENSLQSPLSGPKTPSNAVAKVVEKTPVQPPLPQAHGYCDSDTPSASSMVSPGLLVTSPPMGPSQLTGSVSAPITPILAPALLASSSSPSKSSPVSSLRGPVSSVASTPGKSPLRSCHTNNANNANDNGNGNGNNNNNNNNDTVHHLRRLTTATFPGTPQNFYSPLSAATSSWGSSSLSRQRSPLTRSGKRSSSAATAAAMLRDPTKVAAAAALVSSSTTAWHLHLPIILMNYIQLFFNTLVGVGVLYLLFSATTTVLHDAQLKVDERLQVMMSEIALCSRQYAENRCSPELRVPAMEKACMEWETCMKRDPSTTSRARLHAETIAEILNGFFGAISTRTFVFMIGGSVLLLTLFNAAFYFGKTATATPNGLSKKIKI